MKNNSLKRVSLLIRKKSTSYLKVSFIIFTLSLIMIASIAIAGLSQYTNIHREFIENDNTHTICVSGLEYDGIFEDLTIKDKEDISRLINKNFPNVKYDIFLQSKINIGLSDKDNNHFNFNVIDNDCGQWLKVNELKDNTIYTSDKKVNIPSKVILEIPVLKEVDGGVVSDQTKEFTLNYSNEADPKNIFENYINTPGVHYYINYNTYVNLTSLMYNTPKGEVKNNTVDHLFIYVNQLEDVDKVANLLIEKNYGTDYTIKAIDSLDETLQTIIKVIFILIIIVFLFTCVNLLLSFDSFIKLQKKDIAILKHLGYTNKRIIKIYSINIINIFIKLGLGIVIYSLILGLLILNINYLLHIILLCLIEIASLSIVCAIIILICLRKYVSKNILELMKKDKAFE